MSERHTDREESIVSRMKELVQTFKYDQLTALQEILTDPELSQIALEVINTRIKDLKIG